MKHNYVIVVMSQAFCYHCVEYIKLHACAKFHDHWSNNNKVIMGGGGESCSPLPITDGPKKPISNRVKYSLLKSSLHRLLKSIGIIFIGQKLARGSKAWNLL